jgi:hypothetical protein
MFDKSLLQRPRAASKESILRQADAVRAEARRARRLPDSITDEADRQSLARHVADLAASAARLEKAAMGAKSG